MSIPDISLKLICRTDLMLLLSLHFLRSSSSLHAGTLRYNPDRRKKDCLNQVWKLLSCKYQVDLKIIKNSSPMEISGFIPKILCYCGSCASYRRLFYRLYLGHGFQMWLLILLTAILFYRISKPAGYLMIPYLLWVTFAGYLNLGICLLNG
jgi:hypothetical protein